MQHSRVYVLLITTVLLLFGCCGDEVTNLNDQQREELAITQSPEPSGAAWPGGLPADVLQPWEELDANGKVITSINASTEFVAGVEVFDSSGSTVESGEALQLASGGSGSGLISWAQYRVEMGGVEPGLVAVDANLRRMSDDSISCYYVGLADYSEMSWDWHGRSA